MRTHCLSKQRQLCLAIVLLVAFAAFPNQVDLAAPDYQETIYQEDFEEEQILFWQWGNGWSVILDGGNHVLAGQGHEWARLDRTFNSDMRLSMRVKLLQGRIHLVTHLTDASRYFIGFDADGSDLNKQYFPDEFQNSLAAGSAAHNLNRCYQVEIIFQGSQINFLVDGVQEWSYTDPQPLLSGAIAFETLENSKVYVDDIRLEIVTGTPATTTPPAPAAATATLPSPASLTWVRLGGPLGGLGYDVRMRPDNPDLMYVTDAFAGVFMSDNGGKDWFPSNQGITIRTGTTSDAIPIFSLTIDPNKYDIIWAGTQNTRGIFKSLDAGYTWQKMDNGISEREGITFRGFAVEPGNSNVVYAAAEISSWIWNHGQVHPGREFDMVGGVVYKTTDGGVHWKQAWRGDNLARYIWIDPRNVNQVYVSTGIFDREAANSDPQAGLPGGEGVIKSTDGGLHWTNINIGLKNLYVGTLFMHPLNPDILLAGTGNNQYHEDAGIYLTENGGANWQHVLRGDNIESVEFAISNPSIAYAGSANNIYRSEDGGHTWRVVSGGDQEGWGSPGVRAGFPIDFQVDPRTPDRLFANEYGGGNFLSEDGGKTWIDASRGYTGAQARAIAVDPTQPGHVFVAARSGIFTSFDGGMNWIGLNFSPVVSMEWNMVGIDPSNPQHIIAETNWSNILLNSTNGGYKWNSVFRFSDQRIGWRAVAFAPSNPRIVYVGSAGYFSAGSFDGSQPGQGIFISRDGGITWQSANDSNSQNAHVASLAVDPTNTQIVYAATSGSGLLKTSNGGQSWIRLTGLWSNQERLIFVAVNPAVPEIVFLGIERGGLFISMDGGNTWKHSIKGLIPEGSIASIVFDPTRPLEVMYLADLLSGVYSSVNGGANWTVINNGLRMRAVTALAISADGQHIYAATEGEGAFRLDLNGQPPESVSSPTPSPTITRSPTEIAKQGTLTNEAATPPAAGPTATPGTKPGICGGAAMIPLAIIGLAWFRRRRW